MLFLLGPRLDVLGVFASRDDLPDKPIGVLFGVDGKRLGNGSVYITQTHKEIVHAGA